MKLTKGKISKLYKKKKQSLKKVKKNKSSYKRRTFRNKKNFNLARKTLKRFNYKRHKGGAKEGEKNEEESLNINSNVNPTNAETTNVTDNKKNEEILKL